MQVKLRVGNEERLRTHNAGEAAEWKFFPGEYRNRKN